MKRTFLLWWKLWMLKTSARKVWNSSGIVVSMQKQPCLLHDICREQNMKYILFDLCMWIKYVYKKTLHCLMFTWLCYMTLGWPTGVSCFFLLLFNADFDTIWQICVYFSHYLGKTALNVIKSHWTGLMCCCWFVGGILRSRNFTTIKAKNKNTIQTHTHSFAARVDYTGGTYLKSLACVFTSWSKSLF